MTKRRFSLFLKASTVCGALRRSGRAFRRRGVAEQNAQSPKVPSLVLGGLSRFPLLEHGFRDRVLDVRSSLREVGTFPLMYWWANRRRLGASEGKDGGHVMILQHSHQDPSSVVFGYILENLKALAWDLDERCIAVVWMSLSPSNRESVKQSLEIFLRR